MHSNPYADAYLCYVHAGTLPLGLQEKTYIFVLWSFLWRATGDKTHVIFRTASKAFFEMEGHGEKNNNFRKCFFYLFFDGGLRGEDKSKKIGMVF